MVQRAMHVNGLPHIYIGGVQEKYVGDCFLQVQDNGEWQSFRCGMDKQKAMEGFEALRRSFTVRVVKPSEYEDCNDIVLATNE